MEKELKMIAEKYCNQMGYEFIFANDYKFGFEDKHGQLWTMTYLELADKLMKEENRKDE